MELLYNEKIVKATLDDMLTVVDEVNKEIIVDKNDDIKKLKPADLVRFRLAFVLRRKYLTLQS